MGPGDLRGLLRSLSPSSAPDVLVDMATGDDAGVVRLDGQRALIHTVDVITPIVDEPVTFGRVAAANALSDVYAMGGEPMTAVSILGVPKGLPVAALSSVMRGAQDTLRIAGAHLVGGHTLKDHELRLGFAVTGMAVPRALITNTHARPHDRVVLTKALGTGVLYQAMKEGVRSAAETRAVVTSMTRLNREAAAVMVQAGIRAATDVTGFGLIGHALNIARGSDVDIVLDASALPALPGVLAHLVAGRRPGTTQVNLDGYGRGFIAARGVSGTAVALGADPQTSGGLLMMIPPRKVAGILQEIEAWEIGEVRVKRAARPTVRMLRGVA